MTLRLGCIDYLNTLPVQYGIETGVVPCAARLVKGTPADLNELFRQGQVDVAPISSIQYARLHREALVLPGLCVAAAGEVQSILLFSRRPPPELGGGEVALTTASATSVVLARILLERYYRVAVRYRPARPILPEMLERSEAALLIGDDALRAAEEERQRGKLVITDLGEAWREWTGEAMVYALWAVQGEVAVRQPAELAALVGALGRSLQYGQSHREELVGYGAGRAGLPLPTVQRYFNTIGNELTPVLRRGLMTYFRWALAVGELPDLPGLRFWVPREEMVG